MSRTSRFERIAVVAALAVSTGAGIPTLTQSAATTDIQTADPTPVWIWYLLYAILLVVALRSWREIVDAASKAGWVIAVTGWVLASVVWSQVPGLTLHRAVALALTTLLGLLLAVRYDLEELFELACWVLAAVTIAGVAVAVLDPAYGLDRLRGDAWRGLFDTKNELGRIASLTAVMWVLRLAARRGRTVSLAVLAISVLAIDRSGSRTSLVVISALVVLVVALPALRAPGELMIGVAALLVALLGSVTYWLLEHPGRVLGDLGASSTLTGRTQIWSATWTMVKHHFWFGYGYGAFWRGLAGPSAYIWATVGSTPPHSHNGFLDAWVDLGLVGVALVVLSLVAALSSAWSVLRSPGSLLRAWPFVFVVFLVLFNITESSLVARNGLFWILFVAVTATTGLERSRARVHARSISRPSRTIVTAPGIRT